jgi:hypothetical protein
MGKFDATNHDNPQPDAASEASNCANWARAVAGHLHKEADHVAAAPIPTSLGKEILRFDDLKGKAEGAIGRLTGRDQIDRDRCIYVLALDEQANRETLISAFKSAKETKRLKLPQVNSVKSRVLYVGSSCATKSRARTLLTRLRQHLIGPPSGTYAMHLSEWASELAGGVIIQAWQYPSVGEGEKGDDAARRVVLAVEDWLANELKPILGRRGSRH